MLPYVKEESRKRLNRIEGQIRGINKMVKEEKYCIEILTQIAAARAALDKTGLVILKGHMETCLTDAIKKKQGQELINEINTTITRFLR